MNAFNRSSLVLIAALSIIANLAYGQTAPRYSNASLKGTYALSGYGHSNPPQSILNGPLPARLPKLLGFESYLGTFVFNGAGKATASFVQNTDGKITTGTMSWTYSVAANGAVSTVGGGLAGTVVENGDVLLLGSKTAGDTPNILVLVRQLGTNDNTSHGADSLLSNTTGIENTADGAYSMYKNSTGNYNTASGYYALSANSAGDYNTASGGQALLRNTTGANGTAVGAGALLANTTGANNIAVGYRAGINLTTGGYNIDIGSAGVAAESNVIRLGTLGRQTATYVAGIDGVTTGLAGSAVMIDANGQLGTISSSRRYKQDIQPMADASERLLKLRPVKFRYKQHNAAGEKPIQYGLIAEEVAKVFPELVVMNQAGQPETVAYHLLPALLLNELQKQHQQLVAEQRRNQQQTDQLAEVSALKQQLAAQASQLESQASQLAHMEELLASLQYQAKVPQVAMR